MSSSSINVRGLLRNDAGAGYPRDYVIARLHGRRVRIAPARAVAIAGDEEIWTRFLRELSWLFHQMNEPMRVGHAPLFTMFEIKTIVLCLRHAAPESVEPRRRLLAHSLLSAPLRDILLAPRHVGAVVTGLGQSLGSLSASFADLDARYFEAGLRGCEDAMMRLFLESMGPTRLVVPLRWFFDRFIDLRNLMALYKHLRWELKGPVMLIGGGSIPAATLKDIIFREDRDALDALVTTVTGRAVSAAHELSLETMLLSSLSAGLSRARREHGGEWLVTDYMWSCYVHARNLAVRSHAADLDATVLERELIA